MTHCLCFPSHLHAFTQWSCTLSPGVPESTAPSSVQCAVCSAQWESTAHLSVGSKSAGEGEDASLLPHRKARVGMGMGVTANNPGHQAATGTGRDPVSPITGAGSASSAPLHHVPSTVRQCGTGTGSVPTLGCPEGGGLVTEVVESSKQGSPGMGYCCGWDPTCFRPEHGVEQPNRDGGVRVP